MSKRRLACIGAAGCFCLLAFGCGIGFGLLHRTEQVYQQQYLDERELIDPLLASDPAFHEIKCSRRSSGGGDLSGEVPTKADRARLEARVVRLVGERRASEIVLAVHARP